MVAQPSFFPTFVGGSDAVGSGLTDLAESGVIVCRLCDNDFRQEARSGW